MSQERKEAPRTCVMPMYIHCGQGKLYPFGSPWSPRRGDSKPPHRRERRLEVDSPNLHPQCLWTLPEALVLCLQIALPGPGAKSQVCPGPSGGCGVWTQPSLHPCARVTMVNFLSCPFHQSPWGTRMKASLSFLYVLRC